MENDCLFCKIAGKTIPSDIVYEDKEMLAFRDINPKAPVHVLFVPKKHVATVNDLSAEDAQLLARMFLKARDVAEDSGIADAGYRIVANCNKDAGQEVFHLHIHLLGGRKFGWPPG
jgi:histidine triad (HIT) family protein